MRDLLSEPLNELQSANLSGWVNENQGSLIRESDLDSLRDLRTPGVDEKAIKLLRYLTRLHPSPGQTFAFRDALPSGARPGVMDFPRLLGVSWAKDKPELDYLVNTYLVRFKTLLEYVGQTRKVQITPAGWEQLSMTSGDGQDSTSAFVAMWFNDET